MGSMSTHTDHVPFPQVTRLCDLSVEGDSVTSVGWSERVSTQAPSPGWAGLAQGRSDLVSLAGALHSAGRASETHRSQNPGWRSLI